MRERESRREKFSLTRFRREIMEDCVQRLGECSQALTDFQKLDDRDPAAKVLSILTLF